MRIILMTLALIVGFAGTGLSADTGDHVADEYRYVKITRQRNDRPQENFSVMMFADGTTIYNGASGLKEAGFRSFKSPTAVFLAVSDLLMDEQFRNHDKAVATGKNGCIDHSTVYIIEDRSRETSLDREGWKPTHVLAKMGCNNPDAEVAFKMLFEQAADLMDAERLTGTRDAIDQLNNCSLRDKACSTARRDRADKNVPDWYHY